MSGGRVAAVVLNWCSENDSAACVNSIVADAGDAVHVVIVDNGSPDGSGARLAARFPQCTYVQTHANLGYAGGNARGIAAALDAGAEFVLVINDDAEVREGCISALVAALDAAPGAAAAAPTIVHAGAPNIVWWAGGRFDAMRALGLHEYQGRSLDQLPAIGRSGAPPRDVSAVTGCVVMLRASTVRELGGFRHDFESYVEDTELSVRWRKAGRKLLHVPSALAVHKVPFPPEEPSPDQLRLRDRNRRRLARLHYDGVSRARFAAWFGCTRLALAAAYALRRDGARTRAIVRGALER